MQHGPEGQQFLSVVRHSLDAQDVAGQRLPRHQDAQVVSEVGEARSAARLAVQVPEVELPAARLLAAVLAHQAVQPALDPALQAEIGWVDGQHQGGIEHARIEPVRQDQFDAQRHAAGIGQFLPLVDPREAMQSPSRGFADGRGHRGRLQPVERGFQALVVVERRAAPDEAQDLVGSGAYPARRAQARVARLHDLRGGPNQQVGIPYRCDAVLLRTLHADGDAAGAEVDRRGTPRLRQREERKGHQVLAVAGCHVARQRAEQVELFALQGLPWRAGHGDGHPRASDQRPSR